MWAGRAERKRATADVPTHQHARVCRNTHAFPENTHRCLPHTQLQRGMRALTHMQMYARTPHLTRAKTCTCRSDSFFSRTTTHTRSLSPPPQLHPSGTIWTPLQHKSRCEIKCCFLSHFFRLLDDENNNCFSQLKTHYVFLQSLQQSVM